MDNVCPCCKRSDPVMLLTGANQTGLVGVQVPPASVAHDIRQLITRAQSTHDSAVLAELADQMATIAILQRVTRVIIAGPDDFKTLLAERLGYLYIRVIQLS